MKSNWDKLKEYLTKIPQGTEVTRQQLLVEFFPKLQDSTLDKYRRMLTIMGTLDETGKPGVYRKGYVDLPTVYTKNYTETKMQELYVIVPTQLLDFSGKDWNYWERWVFQNFKPEQLLKEWSRGMITSPDPNCLGFRFYRVKVWNVVVQQIKTLQEK